MSAFYADETGNWQPFETASGGGPVEKLPLDASLGMSNGPALAAAVGDEIWDYYEPFVGAVNLSYAFQGMSGITTVPLFDTSSVTTMTSMFNGCSSLTEVPAFDTSAVTGMGSMFNGCSSLVEVPAISMAAPTSTTPFTNAFGQAGTAATNRATQLRSCTRFRAYGATRRFVISGTLMDAEALNELMANLGTAGGAQTLNIQNNPGSATCDPSIAEAKGWTVLV